MIINQLLNIRVEELQLKVKSRVDVPDRTLDQSVCEQGHRYATAGVPAGEDVWD